MHTAMAASMQEPDGTSRAGLQQMVEHRHHGGEPHPSADQHNRRVAILMQVKLTHGWRHINHHAFVYLIVQMVRHPPAACWTPAPSRLTEMRK